jgi:hypothetical protein
MATHSRSFPFSEGHRTQAATLRQRGHSRHDGRPGRCQGVSGHRVLHSAALGRLSLAHPAAPVIREEGHGQVAVVECPTTDTERVPNDECYPVFALAHRHGEGWGYLPFEGTCVNKVWRRYSRDSHYRASISIALCSDILTSLLFRLSGANVSGVPKPPVSCLIANISRVVQFH